MLDDGLQLISVDSGSGQVSLGQYASTVFMIMFNGKFNNPPTVNAIITKSNIGYNNITITSIYKYGFVVQISHNATGTDTIDYEWQALSNE